MHFDTQTIVEAIDPDAVEGRRQHQPVPVVADEKAFSRWLDLFRWTAALTVVFAHADNRFLMRITDVSAAQRTVPYYAFGFVAGFAELAVMIFFVLSGYLVGGGLWQEARKKKSVDVPRYLLKRVSRLCIVLYPAFLLIAILNSIGIFAFHGVESSAYSADTLHTMAIPALACNAGFLQNSVCHQYGNDGALWSLFHEFWYYIAWLPMVLGFFTKAAWKKAAFFAMAILGLGLLTLIQTSQVPVAPYMLIWLLGVIVAVMPRPIIQSTRVSGILFATSLLLVRLLVRRTFGALHPVEMFLIHFLVSGLFANLLVTMKFDKGLRSPAGKDWNFALAAFSFSLYCIHTPILNLYLAVMQHYTGTGLRMVPDRWWKWAAILGAIALSVVVAFLFSRVTEARTAALRKWLERVLGIGNDPSRGLIRFD